MAKSSNQKLKLLYVMDYLLRESDEEHPLTAAQIISHLAVQGIEAHRKSIYDDIEMLRVFGLDVVQTGNTRAAAYYIAAREFELPELKLLVDSVLSSRFITQKKTSALIKKIETLCSIHEAELLHRQVYVSGRIKTMNESIFYNVDAIHSGISQNKKIRFHYFEMTATKERRFRHDGAFYIVSPYALTWDNQNYYLIAYDSDSGAIRHYRVDRMTDIETLEEPRTGQRSYDALDMSGYTGRVFGMFAGKEVQVRMQFSEHLAGAVIDRLGQDAMLALDGDGQFTVIASVVPSPQFFAWLVGFGDEAKLLGPSSIVRQFRDHINHIAALYE